MKLGVCYYPEHWPTERWATDARLMREAGLTMVRIGEFAWGLLEASENQFTFDWLEQAIDTLTHEGLQVILGTPTATPPAWLCRAYPNVLPVDVQGRRRRFGSRRHYCSNSQEYRRHTRRIVTALAERFGHHPGIIGWQIDNEFGCHDTARCYCDECAAAFRIWLQARYGSIQALNEAWGAVFWSQSYSSWEEIEPPILTITEPNPSQVLDYYRFSSDAVVQYQQTQIDQLRASISSRQFITHNFMGNFPDVDYHDLARPLDFVTWDSYPTGYAELQAETLYAPGEPRPEHAFDTGDPYVTGFCHDLTRGLKQNPFWVMEQQCGNVNWAAYNTGIRPGTVRLWTWEAAAHGAEAVLYFRWRACLYAQEQQHGGLLHHDASPDVGYQDVLTMKMDVPSMTQLSRQKIATPIAIMLDYADLWAIQLQPHRRDFGYLRHLFVFYRALAQLGVAIDIVSPEANLDGYKLIFAPTAFMADLPLAEKMRSFAKSGGTLVLGVRSGFKTPTNLVTAEPLPGALRDLVGATVTGWHSLPPAITYGVISSLPGLTGAAQIWAEAIGQVNGAGMEARPLASYTSGPMEGSAALVEHRVGRGQVLYWGWYPTVDQVRSLATYLLDRANIEHFERLPDGVIVIPRGTYRIALNFTDQPVTLQIKRRSITVKPRDILLV